MRENQGSIRVKFHATGEEVSIDMHDLHEWIAGGHVAAEDLINGRILTNGEWKPAKDLAVFRLADTGVLPDSIAARLAEISGSDPNQPVVRYVALRLVSKLCIGLAVIIMGFALIAAVSLGSMFSSNPFSGESSIGGFVTMSILLQGGFAALILFAMAAVIPLWIDIESNTRQAANSAASRASSSDE